MREHGTRNRMVRAKTKQSNTSENPGIVALNKGRKAREPHDTLWKFIVYRRAKRKKQGKTI
ncbi:hypothetical protein ALC56_05424 [Trachymyrmex septentrionalis]|uniref:Uncharacterized protein n=1 Tax=Trachymyrmex septentrionalis TaxID=34720 RepID=A0A195FKF5_9HYME|nr:hypothetical protein ALC56_05424 [Trachymyrmex septentrionalis]